MFAEKHPVGSSLEGEVKNKTEFGLFLGLEGDVDGMVHLSDLDWKRPGEQIIEEFKKGDKIDGRVTLFDKRSRKVTISIKAREIAEEKEAVAQYGSSDAGATLGDILGSVLKRATDKKK